MKKFFLNGQEYRSSKKLTLSEFIDYFNYNSSLLVLEYNNFLCPKEKWDEITIKENDRIEVVTIVGGG